MLTVNCFLRILSYLTLYRVKSFYKLLVHFLTTQISGESVSYNTITPFLPLRQATLRQRIQQYQVFCDMLKNDKCLPLSVKMKYRHNIQRPCDRQGHFLALKRCELSPCAHFKTLFYFLTTFFLHHRIFLHFFYLPVCMLAAWRIICLLFSKYFESKSTLNLLYWGLQGRKSVMANVSEHWLSRILQLYRPLKMCTAE